MTYRRPHNTPTPARVVQLVASAAKLVDSKAIHIHILEDFGTKAGLIGTKEFYGFQTLTPAQRAQLSQAPTGTLV